MSDRRHRRVENIRLVRQPDGSLAMEKQEAVAQNVKPVDSVPAIQQSASQQQTRRSARHAVIKTTQKKQKGQDIDDVWKEQIKLKEEAERLEIEYRVAKKMAKELKQKMKEQEPLVYGDPVFSDLLSPEVKDFGKKLKPYKEKATQFVKRHTKTTTNKAKVAGRIVGKKSKKIRKKHLLFVLPVIIVMIGGFVIRMQFQNKEKTEVQSATTTRSPSDIPLNQTPDFDPLLPSDKTTDQLGGLARISPEGQDAVYAFVDVLEGQQLNVSEQKVPEAFKQDRDAKLEKLAKDFQAVSVIQVDDTRVYHGVSEKTKVQSLIFVKDDLLVFIKSPQKFTDDIWVGYITNLK